MQLYKGLNLPLCVLLKVMKNISLISLCLPHCAENSLEKSEFFTVFNSTLLFPSQTWSIKLQPLHNLNGNIPSLCWCLNGSRYTQELWFLLTSTSCTHHWAHAGALRHTAQAPLAHEEITPGKKCSWTSSKGGERVHVPSLGQEQDCSSLLC